MPTKALVFWNSCAARLQREVVVGVPLHVGVGRDQEARRPGRRVLHDLAGLRLHHLDHRLDQRARREVLAGAALGLAGVLLEEPLVHRAQAVGLGREPVEVVDRADELGHEARLAQRGLGAGVDRLDQRVLGPTQVEEHRLVGVELIAAGRQRLQVVPATAGG
jgi:hypothetical protein